MALRLAQVIGAAAFGGRATLAYETLVAKYEREGLPRVTRRYVAKKVRAIGGEDVNETTVGRWLNGKQPPDTLASVLSFALALEVDPGWLAFGSMTKACAPNADASAEGGAGLSPAPYPDRELTEDAAKRSAGRPRATGR